MPSSARQQHARKFPAAFTVRSLGNFGRAVMRQNIDNYKLILNRSFLSGASLMTACERLVGLCPARRFRSFGRWAARIVVVSICFLIAPAFADVSKETQLKAVFLWRLAQF